MKYEMDQINNEALYNYNFDQTRPDLRPPPVPAHRLGQRHILQCWDLISPQDNTGGADSNIRLD